MILTQIENSRLTAILSPYMEDIRACEMRKYIQHGAVSTFQHCVNVARVSFWINRRLKCGSDERALAIGAFLHDFYLYDWHVKDVSHRLHGFSHALAAKNNAVKYFDIGDKEQKIIASHMWPLNITCVPRSREALIVCIADKYCSLVESLAQRKRGRIICG